MKQMKSLIKREFLEYKGSFTTVPLLLSSFILFVFIFLTPNFNGVPWNAKIYSELNLSENLESFYLSLFYIFSFPFFFVLFFTQLNYFSHTLFSDRKDRSVLFWFSMPVSELKAIIAKYILGLLLMPIVYGFYSLMTVGFLLLYFYFKIPVEGISIFDLFIYIKSCFSLFFSYFYMSFWLFPVFAWALFCSAYAKKSPFIMAFLFPLLVIFFELLLKGGNSYLLNFISLVSKNMFQGNFRVAQFSDALVACGVGSFLTGSSLYLRRRCFRFDFS